MHTVYDASSIARHTDEIRSGTILRMRFSQVLLTILLNESGE